MNTQKIIKAIESKKARSAWDKGVKNYAIDLVADLKGREVTKENLLNGARDWSEFSYGGSSLIYDGDICEALCSPSEVKRTDTGRLRPNSNETWLDVQARALSQACRLIMRATKFATI